MSARAYASAARLLPIGSNGPRSICDRSMSASSPISNPLEPAGGRLCQRADHKASNGGLPSRLAQQASKRGRLRGESGKVTVALSFDHLRAGLRPTSSPLAGASA
jgi:hypothetical protein